MSLAGLRGKTVLLTFLDPACGGGCPPVAREFSGVDQILGPAAGQLELVAIAACLAHCQVADTAAFTRRERLSQVPNWLFLTGPPGQLRKVWKEYAIPVSVPAAGSPAGLSTVAFVIDKAGQVRARLDDDQALWTAAGEASFAVLLAGTASATSNTTASTTGQARCAAPAVPVTDRRVPGPRPPTLPGTNV